MSIPQVIYILCNIGSDNDDVHQRRTRRFCSCEGATRVHSADVSPRSPTRSSSSSRRGVSVSFGKQGGGRSSDTMPSRPFHHYNDGEETDQERRRLSLPARRSSCSTKRATRGRSWSVGEDSCRSISMMMPPSMPKRTFDTDEQAGEQEVVVALSSNSNHTSSSMTPAADSTTCTTTTSTTTGGCYPPKKPQRRASGAGLL